MLITKYLRSLLLLVGLLIVILCVVLVVLLLVLGLVVALKLLHLIFAWLLFFDLDDLYLLRLARLRGEVRLCTVGVVVRLGEWSKGHLLLILQLLLVQIGFLLSREILLTSIHHLLFRSDWLS